MCVDVDARRNFVPLLLCVVVLICVVLLSGMGAVMGLIFLTMDLTLELYIIPFDGVALDGTFSMSFVHFGYMGYCCPRKDAPLLPKCKFRSKNGVFVYILFIIFCAAKFRFYAFCAKATYGVAGRCVSCLHYLIYFM